MQLTHTLLEFERALTIFWNVRLDFDGLESHALFSEGVYKPLVYPLLLFPPSLPPSPLPPFLPPSLRITL
jgi:hypothetical protein